MYHDFIGATEHNMDILKSSPPEHENEGFSVED